MFVGVLATTALTVAASGAQATLCSLAGGTGSSCTFPNPGGDSSNGGAYYTNPANVDNVGSGVINPFLTVQNKGTESGFSTDVTGNDLPLDDKRNNANTFTNTFSLSELGTVSGAGIGDSTSTYYEFFLDVNEPDNNPDWLISLDYLKIYDTGSSSAVTLGGSTTLSDLDSQGWTLLYDLGSNAVLLNYDLFKGSGNGYDMTLLIPTTAFSSVGSTSNRIVFANTFGSSGSSTSGADSADGFEEWAFNSGTNVVCPPGTVGTPPDCVIVPPQEIPEPAVLSLVGLGLLGLGWTAHRRRS
jgi:hypothetical protein